MIVPEKRVCDVCGKDITNTVINALFRGTKFYECEMTIGIIPPFRRKREVHFCDDCFHRIMDYVHQDIQNEW